MRHIEKDNVKEERDDVRKDFKTHTHEAYDTNSASTRCVTSCINTEKKLNLMIFGKEEWQLNCKYGRTLKTSLEYSIQMKWFHEKKEIETKVS